MKRVLFVCRRNRLRSPTAEQIFAAWPSAGKPSLETASAGLSPDAEERLSPEHIECADTILVMERAHKAQLTARFGKHLKGKRVASLDIPDNYDFMDPVLVELLLRKVPRYISS
ncbi:Protein-tyrosine-phosphatase [Hyphomicrobiales bacterium]|nr:Protein-tyrosine-phosphatase [Hyphomicrobiales bacterium]CAH1667997.1 Protein-tyrosine-phosphatase [Hyphomicrobiales bacterium]